MPVHRRRSREELQALHENPWTVLAEAAWENPKALSVFLRAVRQLRNLRQSEIISAACEAEPYYNGGLNMYVPYEQGKLPTTISNKEFGERLQIYCGVLRVTVEIALNAMFDPIETVDLPFQLMQLAENDEERIGIIRNILKLSSSREQERIITGLLAQLGISQQWDIVVQQKIASHPVEEREALWEHLGKYVAQESDALLGLQDKYGRRQKVLL